MNIPIHILDHGTLRDKGCRSCELWSSAHSIGVIAEGDPGGALFIGIGPGREEDKEGRPFIGRSGRRLRLICANLEITAAFANLVGCIPLKDKPTEAQAACCLGTRLHGLINLYHPTCIVALGGYAAEFLLHGTLHRQKNKVTVKKARGGIFDIRGRPMIVTYHPAYTMRDTNKSALKDLMDDLRWTKKIVDGDLQQKTVEFTPIPTPPEGDAWVVDCETTHLRPWLGELIRVGVASSEALSSPHLSGESPSDWTVEREIQGWNLTFDAQWLPDAVFDSPWMDGMVLHGLLEPDASTRRLKLLGPRMTGIPYGKTLDDDLDETELDQYLSMDLYQTGETIKELKKAMQFHPARRCVPFVMELTRALAKVSKWGIKINHATCLDRAHHYQAQQEDAIQAMREVADSIDFPLEYTPKGFTFSRSVKKMHELIYERLGMPPVRTKEGRLSLDKTARLQLAQHDIHGILKPYGDFLHNQKMVQTYIVPLLEGDMVDQEGFAHPVPNVIKREKEEGDSGGGTVTGRIVWKDPSFQVYPSADRSVVISRHPGGIIGGMDLSQIEPRVLAWRTGEPELLNLLIKGEDFYRGIMSLILGMPVEDVTPQLRRAGKTIYLAIMYGAHAEKIQEIFRLEAGIDVTLSECMSVINSREKNLPQVMAYVNMIRERVLNGDYLISPSGRARKFPQEEDPEILRQAVNWETQGFASDINHAILLELMGLKKVLPIMTVHDENVIDVEGGEIPKSVLAVYEEIPYIIRKWFDVEFTVPIKYGIKSGPHWQ